MLFNDNHNEMLSITLRQLEYATAVARHGGMTAAAQALHVSQPALSVAIRQLEDHLGRPLFLRRAGRIAPTAFGRGWLQAAEAQLAALSRLMAGEGAEAPVRLAVFHDLAPMLLAPILACAAEETPALAVTPEVMAFEPLSDALTGGRIDLALTWDLGLPPECSRRTLARIAPHAVLPAGHPLAARAELKLADLAEQPLILTDQALSLAHFRSLFAARGLTPVIAHRPASAELMRSFAANGFGIGLGYSRPLPDASPDGRPLAIRPILDAGTEALVLAHAPAPALPPAALRLAEAMPRLLPLTPPAGHAARGRRRGFHIPGPPWDIWGKMNAGEASS